MSTYFRHCLVLGVDFAPSSSPEVPDRLGQVETRQHGRDLKEFFQKNGEAEKASRCALLRYGAMSQATSESALLSSCSTRLSNLLEYAHSHDENSQHLFYPRKREESASVHSRTVALRIVLNGFCFLG